MDSYYQHLTKNLSIDLYDKFFLVKYDYVEIYFHFEKKDLELTIYDPAYVIFFDFYTKCFVLKNLMSGRYKIVNSLMKLDRKKVYPQKIIFSNGAGIYYTGRNYGFEFDFGDGDVITEDIDIFGNFQKIDRR